jgi:hypothetical protein
MAFTWGGSKKAQEEAQRKRAEAEKEADKKRLKGKKREKFLAGQAEQQGYEIVEPKNAPRPQHMTYMDAAGGAKVMYTNCYCKSFSGDHSRGEYNPKS